MKIKNFKTILFDFDGTLADTMQDLFLAWKRAFEDFEIEIKKEDYFPLEGMKLSEIAKTISKKYNLSADPLKILELKERYYLEKYSFSLYPGVLNLISSLKNREVKIAIVSASPLEKLVKTAPEEFLSKFDVIISGNDTREGKPSPEPYLMAMKKLNVLPSECIVVENAPLGIKSAKSAGAYCIAVTTTLGKEFLQEADKIISKIKALEKILFENSLQ